MRNIIGLITLALAGCMTGQTTRQAARSDGSAHFAHAKPAAMPAEEAHGFAALEAMTFDCPRAGLNAAAREAARVPSQGSYQFSYFRIVSDAHHSTYEVHFRSNASGEPVLRYCVSIYCQQGWDPRTTQVDVRLMSDAAQGRAAKPDAACGSQAAQMR